MIYIYMYSSTVYMHLCWLQAKRGVLKAVCATDETGYPSQAAGEQ